MSAILNAQDLEKELNWFTQVLDTRFKLYFGQESEFSSIVEIAPPNLADSASRYASTVRHYQMTPSERLMLILALVPHIRPRLLDLFFTKNTILDRPFTEFGGLYEGNTGGFLPTGETLMFLLGSQNLEIRFQALAFFDLNHFFTRHQIFDFQVAGEGASVLKAPLRLTQEYVSLFTTGEPYRPPLSVQFPAEQITTNMEWEDVVLAPHTQDMLREIEAWIQYEDILMDDWEMSARLRPGHRALFYGPPGTGKTVTASLIGKSTGRDVYRIDLSMVISKYIGETEKNLARLFDKAERAQWILFFDEADALFGKRHRYANQEVSYLLQRIESFKGMAIFTSHLMKNLNKTFVHLFESIIHFPLPGAEERLHIWEKGFSPKADLAADVDLRAIAKQFELSGGAIMNVIRYASLEALRKHTKTITLRDLQQGIRREMMKGGKNR